MWKTLFFKKLNPIFIKNHYVMLHHDLLKLRKLLEDILMVLLKTMNMVESRQLAWDATSANGPHTEGSSAPLLGMQEVLQLLNISQSTYYRLVKNGSLQPTKIGNRHYYKKNDLDALFGLFRRKK